MEPPKPRATTTTEQALKHFAQQVRELSPTLQANSRTAPLPVASDPVDPADPASTPPSGAESAAPSYVGQYSRDSLPGSGPPSGAPVIEPDPAEPWERYEDLGIIGRGGMGEVRRVRDRLLGRLLAMKVLPHIAVDEPFAAARFLAEARLTASLQHPGIVPVHDCGMLPDGRLWFTMKEVRGRTFRAAIDVLHEEPAGAPPLMLRRMIDVYLRVCEAVAYAHQIGVLHRDLKPENVMIGELGEVLVMDWGIAAASSAVGEAGSLASPTDAGQLLGTPAYMAPEQLRGAKRVDTRTDVYSLGATLYELLAGVAPYRGTPGPIWAQIAAGPPPPLASYTKWALPGDVVAICERAMARDPAARFADAGALADEVRIVLDGARRRARAIALAEEARSLVPEIASLRTESRRLKDEARARLDRLRPFDPVEDKARAWTLEDDAHTLELSAALREVAWNQKLLAALHEAPDLVEAHEALADVLAIDLVAAEDGRDFAAAARAEALLKLHDRGRHEALLRAEGLVTLHTVPSDAEVEVLRYVDRERRLSAEPIRDAGAPRERTPIHRLVLPRGHYVLRLRAPGRRDALYPVSLGRGEHWDGVAPGTTEPRAIPLLPRDLLDDDEIYVPAGWFICGGDAVAGESLPRSRVWVDGFAVRRHPVTIAEYIDFLNALIDSGREGDAVAACPSATATAMGGPAAPLLARNASGYYTCDASRSARPVASIDWWGAAAYATFTAARTGRPWRLLSELEREKATRGADGRFMPWGDHVEPTWANMVGSRPGAASLAVVSDFATDESPYGVRGLAGNSRDWCAEVWRPEGPDTPGGILALEPAALDDAALRSVRGGAWSAPPTLCRAATRFAAAPDERFSTVGVRLARSLD